MNHRTLALAVFGAALLVGSAACSKKAPIVTAAKPIPPPEPPPPPPAPKAQAARIDAFVAEPANIQLGQTATLRWTVANSTDISINQNIGAVQANGTRQVNPTTSTTYTLTARAAGGNDTRSVTVTVSTPPPPPPPTNTQQPTGINVITMLDREGKDAFFDYDSSDLRADARSSLTQDAALLKGLFAADASFKVTLEGHCDERGSAEYNLGLGDRRSTSAKDYLVQLGIPAERLTPISYGKDKPQCTDATEDCYQRNRRVHMAPAR